MTELIGNGYGDAGNMFGDAGDIFVCVLFFGDGAILLGENLNHLQKTLDVNI